MGRGKCKERERTKSQVNPFPEASLKRLPLVMVIQYSRQYKRQLVILGLMSSKTLADWAESLILLFLFCCKQAHVCKLY